MSFLNTLRAHVQKFPKRIIFPESNDPRVREAALAFVKGGFGIPVFIKAPSVAVQGAEIFEQCRDRVDWFERCVTAYCNLQHAKKIDQHQAVIHLNENPLLLSAVLVSVAYADGGVAGSIATTAEVVRAGLRGIGLARNKTLVSSLFLMELDKRVMSYADCGVVPDPDAEQLAAIALESAASHRVLTGSEPRVALLSFSTKGSAEHYHIDKIRQALLIAQGRQPQLAIDGELQFDAAFVPEVAKLKLAGSPVAGRANVFIFPDLSSGNIAYKITERIGGATAHGPILQGLGKPWMDLSRACTVNDIVDMGVIAAYLSGSGGT